MTASALSSCYQDMEPFVFIYVQHAHVFGQTPTLCRFVVVGCLHLVYPWFFRSRDWPVPHQLWVNSLRSGAPAREQGEQALTVRGADGLLLTSRDCCIAFIKLWERKRRHTVQLQIMIKSTFKKDVKNTTVAKCEIVLRGGISSSISNSRIDYTYKSNVNIKCQENPYKRNLHLKTLLFRDTFAPVFSVIWRVNWSFLAPERRARHLCGA